MAKKAQILHFTSPHLFEFNERFYRNDGVISWEELEEAHQMLSSKSYMQEASYFEYATFLALFLAKDLEFLILEAGLGGEFDSTNVIEEKLSVFTQIGRDHMEILGESIEQIARTKLNSMGKIAFLGIQNHPQVLDIAQEIAEAKQSQLYLLKSYQNDPNFPLFLNQNFALAKQVLNFLGVEAPQMKDLNLIGRMQRVRENIWLDVGHNVDGALALAEEFKNQKITLVYNAYEQKEIAQVLAALKEIAYEIQIIEVQDKRIIKRERLEEILMSLKINYRDFEGFSEDRHYLVFGSFSVIRRALEILDEK